jgi:metallo-beta-lactamase family protein
LGKKKDKESQIKIEFLNQGSSVTGSCTIIKFLNRTILFEFGGIQEGHTTLADYRLNKEQVSKVKAKDVDMIIGGHMMHYDHGGNVPALIKQNPSIRIITGKNTTGILQEMWTDSAFINCRDCEELSTQYPDKVFIPLYTEEDVKTSLSLIEEYDVGEIHELDENVSIRYTYSGHIFGAVQCELFIKIKNHITKLLFTSDLGNQKIQDLKPFVQKFEPVHTAQVVFAECTYGSRNNKQITQKVIDKDLEKIKSVIEQFCKDNKRRVLMPVFSLDKCPVVLWLVYQMFKDDNDFNTKVLVDSPLTNRLLDRYSEVLEGEAKEKFDEMLSWKNLQRIVTPEDSKYAMENMTNVLILSSGGMLQSGRSVRWAKELLPHSNDCLILSGFCGENTLGYKIKNCSDQKTISINGTQVKNKAQIVNIRSLSGHIQRDDMLKYYSSIHADKIYLIHGEMDGKIEFAQDLKEEIANKSMTTGVCVVNKGTTITL